MVDSQFKKFFGVLCLIGPFLFTGTSTLAQENLDQRISILLAELTQFRPNGPNTDHLLPPFDDILAEKNVAALRDREFRFFRKTSEYKPSIFVGQPNAARSIIDVFVKTANLRVTGERYNIDTSIEDKSSQLDAVFQIATHIATGVAVTRNEETYFKLIFEAARRGHAISQSAVCSNIRMRYRPDQLTTADLDSAWFYCQKASDQGEPSAMYQMALMYLGGHGRMPVDRPLAQQLLQVVVKIGGAYAKEASDRLREMASTPSTASQPNLSGSVSQQATPSARRAFSSLISSAQHQRLFNRQLKEKYYPISVVGSCHNGQVLYQSEFVPFGPSPFAFRALHGADDRTYLRVSMEMDLGGFAQAFYNETECGGRRHIHATWTKGLVAAPSTSMPRQSPPAATGVTAPTGSSQRFESQPDQFDCRKMWEEMIALADLSAEIRKKGIESRVGVADACLVGWPTLKDRRAAMIADLEKHRQQCQVEQKLINVAKAAQRTTSQLQQKYCR